MGLARVVCLHTRRFGGINNDDLNFMTIIPEGVKAGRFFFHPTTLIFVKHVVIQRESLFFRFPSLT